MNSLRHELQRLYCLPGQTCLDTCHDAGPQALSDDLLDQALTGQRSLLLALVNAQGQVRTLVMTLHRNQDWPAIAALYAGLEQDLDLPLPALAVLADGGFQLWFSLAEPVPVASGHALLAGLQRRYLAHIPAERLDWQPTAADPTPTLRLVPHRLGTEERWSAFIDPSLGAMFATEAGLDVPPNLEGQANILARCQAIKLADLARALGQLAPPDESPSSAPTAAPMPNPAASQRLPDLGGPFTDPKSFLLALMNCPDASAELRVQAATALLPYCEKAPTP
ncbi:hypothetical protein DLREEDagrD3_14330 [Denitratisoma sp. agr-D3]